MNRLFKKLGFGLALAAVPVSLSASMVTAIDKPAAQSSTARTSEFCTNLPATISRVNSNMGSLQSKLDTAWNNRNTQISSNDAKWDQALAADQAKWAAQRQTQFSELQAKATTDAQKAAVQTYITTLTNAISTRESANAAARTTFRDGLTNLLTTQRSNITSQVATFTDAVNAAEAAAQSACASDASPRTTFISAMKSARQAFETDRKGDSSLGTQVKALAATRDAAIKANNTAFKNTATAAATALKAAFGAASTSISQ
jgi:hypothetical protein